MGELPQLIIVILGVAYAAIRIWTARTKISRESGKAGGPGGIGQAGGNGSDGQPADVIDTSDFPSSKRNRDRFNLSGRDAEVAAKVLKRMLSQGGK
jgi:hypothetical protein